MKASLLASTAAFLLLGTAGTVAAATITETYTGTVATGSSFDLTGLFGKASTQRGVLDGDAFKLVFTIDTSNGTGTYTNAGSAFKSGKAYGLPQAISASLEINGITQQIFGSWFGTASRNNNPTAGTSGLSSLDTSIEDTGYGSAEASITVYDTAIPGNLLTPFTFDPASQSAFNYTSGSFNIGVDSNEAGGSLDITRAVAQVSAVPLPAALPMFGSAILGLGALCRVAKTRKKVVTSGA